RPPLRSRSGLQKGAEVRLPRLFPRGPELRSRFPGGIALHLGEHPDRERLVRRALVRGLVEPTKRDNRVLLFAHHVLHLCERRREARRLLAKRGNAGLARVATSLGANAHRVQRFIRWIAAQTLHITFELLVTRAHNRRERLARLGLRLGRALRLLRGAVE